MDITGLPKLNVRGTIAPSGGFLSLFDGETFSASDLTKFLEDNKDAKKIVLEISSPGGFVSEGFEIYDRLKASGKEIITIGYSVNSIATVVFLAGTKRYVSDNVSFIIHNARIDPMMLGMDPLTADDLTKLAEETEKTDERILNLYCSVLGEDNRSALLALMGAETDLGSKGALKYKFAHGLWKNESAKDSSKEKKVKNICIEECMTNYVSIINQMEKEKTEKLESKLDKLFNAVSRLFKMRNDVTLEAGDKKIIVITEDEELVGKKAVYADAEGLPTEEVVPEGEHALSDGRTLVVGADGIVSEVKEGEDVEALKKELEDTKAENEELKTQLQNQITQGKEILNSLKQLKKDFEDFKKEVPGDPDKKDKKDGDNTISPEQWNKMSTAQRLRAMSIEKYQNNAK